MSCCMARLGRQACCSGRWTEFCSSSSGLRLSVVRRNYRSRWTERYAGLILSSVRRSYQCWQNANRLGLPVPHLEHGVRACAEAGGFCRSCPRGTLANGVVQRATQRSTTSRNSRMALCAGSSCYVHGSRHDPSRSVKCFP